MLSAVKLKALDLFFRRLGGAWTSTFSLLLILLLSWFDWVSGYELSFSVFYLVPVSLAAWYSRGRSCYVLGFSAAAAWQFSNALAGETLSHPIYYFWNALTRLGFYAVMAYVLRELRSVLARERKASRRDHLTGLYNLKAFEESLEREHARALRHQKPLAVGFIDLDNFKKVNDGMGHAEGDRVLTRVAQALTENLRKSDVIGRVGGDEFVILLPQTGLDEGEAVARKLVDCLTVLSTQEGWPISASLGLVALLSPRAEQTTAEILKLSDALMYKVKEKGKNAYLVEGVA